MSCLNDRISALQKEVVALSQETQKDEAARKQLLGVCQMSMGMVATPGEQIWQMLMQPHLSASIRSCMEIGVFDILNNSERPVSAEVMARTTGADKLLIVRLLRPLAGIHVVIETGFETYLAGPVCKALDTPALKGGWLFMHDEAGLACVQMHAFLKEIGYKNPVDPSKGNFQFSHQTDIPLFPFLMQRPQQLGNFFNMLEGWRVDRTEWFDIYPVQEQLLGSFDPREGGETFLVDIGGATGYDIQNFKKHFEGKGHGMPGKLVLQDLPFVIADIKDLDSEIERMPYDFFTPQPVAEAKAYYMRSICHDWSDERVRELLANTVKVMKPGYSRLLINDWVVKDTGASLLPALLDINMMALLSGMERTESQWKTLLGSVGLQVVKFWQVGPETEGLVECVKMQE